MSDQVQTPAQPEVHIQDQIKDQVKARLKFYSDAVVEILQSAEITPGSDEGFSGAYLRLVEASMGQHAYLENQISQEIQAMAAAKKAAEDPAPL